MEGTRSGTELQSPYLLVPLISQRALTGFPSYLQIQLSFCCDIETVVF